MNASSKDRSKRRTGSRTQSHLMPVLVVAGGVCGLGTVPANALELGDIQVNSALGQPLRASIAYALNANEQLHGYCISLRSGAQGSDAPAINDARISLNGNRIQISGNEAIREPLFNMQVVVNCAYTPRLTREYNLMIDPIVSNVAARSMLADTVVTQPGGQAVTAAAIRPARSTSFETSKPVVVDRSPISTNTSYQVRSNDTVSTIVSRIDNRTMALWPAVNMIFAANPDAFANQDVNRLIAGTELFIPDLSGIATTGSENSTVPTTGNIEEPVADTELLVAVPAAAAEALPVIDNDVAEVVEDVVSAIETPVDNNTPVAEEEILTDNRGTDLQPGDVVMPAAGTTQTEIVSPETAVDSQPANVPVVSSTPTGNTGTSSAWGWLFWLAGSGIALFLGLLLFGRKLKDRFGAPDTEKPAATDTRPNIAADVDFEFDDTISAEAISLDADLEAGTGLDAVARVDVAEDFGFSANGQAEHALDLEITEAAALEPEASPTDIIAPNHREDEPSILDTEEPPIEDEYDLSMIVDATKQPLDQFDATAKDLKAVQVNQVTASADDSDYTMSNEVDLEVLEQDYQEEFTATMAANAEIERVAMELANRMDKNESTDVTREMPSTSLASDELIGEEMMAELQDLDVTNEAPKIESAPVPNSDNTAELTANLLTSIDAENDPDIEGSDASVEMSAGSDITAEMPVRAGKANSKKK